MCTELPAAKDILLVEDQADQRLTLACLLEGRGYAVRCATNGREALDRLQAGPPPALILLDLVMPGLDGWEFRERQRRDPALAPIPVVVLSATGMTGESANRLGDVGYLQKPVDPDELFAAVERFVSTPRRVVLVVDDEPAVRGMLDMALRHYGFAALQAGGGEEAVEIYRRYPGAIDVVLLDVRMPGMDGPQTLAALRGINPAVRCVFMTGTAGTYTADDLQALGAARILQKPFVSLGELCRALWDAARRVPG